MAHQTEIVVNGVVTEVTEFDHTAQEIDDSVDRAILSLLAVAAAGAYNPEESYAVGDYCTHGGKLHKCGTAIPDGEAWNAEHWTETTVTAELAEVRASLSNKAIATYQTLTAQNLLDWAIQQNSSGAFLVNPNITTDGLPNAGEWYVGFLEVNDNYDRKITITNHSQNTYQNMCGKYNGSSNIVWKGWIPITTATPPEEYNIPLADGITALQPCTYYKNQFGEVTIGGTVAGTISQGTIIGTLPEGFRPGKFTERPANIGTGSTRYPGTVTITKLGVISITTPAQEMSAVFAASFIAID